MARIGQRKHWLGVGAGLSLALGVAIGPALVPSPVWAQGGSVFDSLFGGFSAPRYRSTERQTDFTRAPPPRKADTVPPNSVLVLGDSMSDWLAYGLDDALSESPELGVVRMHRAGSGLIRYDTRNDAQTWAQVARDAIAKVKPKFVVIMLGLNDRQAIRERPAQRQAAATPGSPPSIASVPRSGALPDSPDQPNIMKPEGHTTGSDGVDTFEYRTEAWAEHYAKRVDATIDALKSAAVPVFWVGLPSLRGPKSTGDMLYLNDLYRTRAEKAGITYVDVWDGFVDENGRYVVHGPDFEGQTRRLRVSDGVHFTKAGARKLAHYVEREIRRVMTRGSSPVALPASEPQQQTAAARPGVPTARPLSGPVLPLTATAGAGEELVGAENTHGVTRHPTVARVLVNGEAVAPPAGRSDDFVWPRRGVAPFGTDPVVATTTDPIVVMRPPEKPTVSAPKVDTRAVTGAGSRRTTGRATPPQRRRSSNRSGFPFR